MNARVSCITDGWGELSPGGQQQSRLQCGDVRHNYGQPGSQRQSVCSRPDTVRVYGSLHYTPPATFFNVFRVYAVDLTVTEVCQVKLGQPAVVGFLPRSLHYGWRLGVVASVIRCMKEVTVHWARLVLGWVTWVTVFGRVYHHGV